MEPLTTPKKRIVKRTKTKPVTQLGSVTERTRTRADGTSYIVFRAQVRDPRDATRNIEQTFSAARYGKVKARKLAHTWVHDQLAAIDAGTWRDADTGKAPLSTVIEQWRKTWNGKLAPKTQASYSAIIRKHIEPTFAKTRVDSIGASEIQAWVDKLKADHEPQTVHNAYTVMRGALKFATRRKLIAANPCTPDAIDLPSKTNDRSRPTPQRYLEPDELADLIAALPEHWRTPVLVAGWCGLRSGELWALRRRDVNTLFGELHVEHAIKDIGGKLSVGSTKTHATRTLSIEDDPDLIAALSAALARPGKKLVGIKPGQLRGYASIKDGKLAGTEDPDDEDRLLFTTPGGAPVSHGNFYARVYKPAVAKAIGRPVRFHDLRHSAASYALAVSGNVEASLVTVMKRLGHKNVATTADIYGGLIKGADREVSGGLAALRAQAKAASAEPVGKS